MSADAGQGGRREQAALVAVLPGGNVELRAPSVGEWSGAPASGNAVWPGAPIGALTTLGRRVRLVVPPGVQGLVVAVHGVGGASRLPVEYGQRLLVVDPKAEHAAEALSAGAAEARGGGAELVFRAPSSGRFYVCPAPGEPPFVAAGGEVVSGQAVGLLEVMKTFHSIHYGGAELPARARVARVLVADGADVEGGQALLELTPLAD